MSRNFKIALNFLAVLAVGTYLIVTLVVVYNGGKTLRFTKLDVVVEDSVQTAFVRSADIKGYILDSIAPLGCAMHSVDLAVIESQLLSNPYIGWCEVSSTTQGAILVRVRQLRPIMRVLGQNGYNFYIDSSLNIMRRSKEFHPTVPTISGTPCFGFSKEFFGRLDKKKYSADVESLKKLINFVSVVEADDFLNGLLTQIYVTCGSKGELEVTAVPSVGRAVIYIGGIDGMIDHKLHKIKAFYRSAYSHAGLDSATVVDARFKNQIIVR